MNTKTLFVAAVFIVTAFFYFSDVPGDDLFSSYMGGRLWNEGQADKLYVHHPVDFHVVDDPTWIEIARDSSFEGFMHPYVQTPLWAALLAPLARVLSFSGFNQLFLFLHLSAWAVTVLLVAGSWAPTFKKPVGLMLAFALLAISTPFRYAMFLNQTHALFILITVSALLLASQRHPRWGGMLLAVAFTVKIIPGMFGLFWLLTRRYTAFLSFLLFSTVFALLTLAVAGWEISHAFLGELRRVGSCLLVSYNNQSLVSFLGEGLCSYDDIWNWTQKPLPGTLKILSINLMGLAVLLSALLERKKDGLSRDGQALAISGVFLSMTIFSPIAWTHYYTVLIIPILVMTDRAIAFRRHGVLWGILLVILLNMPPLALDPISPKISGSTLIRSHLLSGLIAWIMLFPVGRWQKGGPGQSQEENNPIVHPGNPVSP